MDGPAIERQGAGPNADAVAVGIGRQHGVAEGQRLRPAPAGVPGLARAGADGQRDLWRPRHRDGELEPDPDFDHFACSVGVPARRRTRYRQRVDCGGGRAAAIDLVVRGIRDGVRAQAQRGVRHRRALDGPAIER